MSHLLAFDLCQPYDSRKVGITLETRLAFGERRVVVSAKVDPGADFCLFQREVADDLEIVVESGDRMRFGTLAGSLDAYGHTLTFSTCGLEFESHVYFAAAYGLQRNLLGRTGWLQKLRLAIIDYDSTLYLSEYDGPE